MGCFFIVIMSPHQQFDRQFTIHKEVQMHLHHTHIPFQIPKLQAETEWTHFRFPDVSAHTVHPISSPPNQSANCNNRPSRFFEIIIFRIDLSTGQMKPITIRAPVIIQFLATLLFKFPSVIICRMFIPISVLPFALYPYTFIHEFPSLIYQSSSSMASSTPAA